MYLSWFKIKLLWYLLVSGPAIPTGCRLLISIINPLKCISTIVLLTVTLESTFKRQFYYHSMQNKAHKIHWSINMRSLENMPQTVTVQISH